MALPIDPRTYDAPDAPTPEEQDPEEAVLEVAAHLEVPEGYRVQVIDGRIIVTSPADGGHAVALTRLLLTLWAAGAQERGLDVLQGVGIYLRPGKKGFAIPDLAVVEKDSVNTLCRSTATHPASSASSPRSRPPIGRMTSRARSRRTPPVGVPVYVIADREHGRVLVLSRPHEGAYQSTAEYLPGDTVVIPGPLPCKIAAEELLQG